MQQSYLDSLKEMWQYRDLLGELVARDLKGRYRRSLLGFFWSLITPIYQIIIYTFVLKYILNVGGSNLSINILVAIIPWTFFNVTVMSTCASVIRYRAIVKKVYFPRQMLPLSTVLANLVHLILSTVVLFVIFLIIPVAFDERFVFLIPLAVAETVLIAGLGFIFACAHTYYTDVEFALGNIMSVAMFVHPVLYSFSALNHWKPIWRTLYMLNPMAVFCEGWRSVLLRQELPDMNYFLIACATSVLLFFVGLFIWHRYEWRFPEML